MSEISDLIEAATLARDNAYAPYSKFAVGAAIRAEDGRIYAGANVENAAFPQGQCAEATAIGAMVSAGARRILEMVVLGEGAVLVTPCGGCRQRIREFAGRDVRIHLVAADGAQHSVTIGELLPLAFGPEHLG
ncbi:MAG: cdd [Rhodospirillales bacterium]|jgi:cytidine deaminase|nr:cdd [Rhodospirillales bacterium]